MSDTKLLRWARSESEAAELQAQGWKLAEHAISHHSQWSLLLEWTGDKDPPQEPQK